ncbi:MAG TPA: pentapeptide repeat-containing protein [Candidatus Limnocylindrales bacterium]|nr:pentapeptide repeat-containing protein [Candidatus Limnocylindrales bacterium]
MTIMPDLPAKKIFGFSWSRDEKLPERLATPEEQAEFGAQAPNPETEGKILALFEEQLMQDLVKGTSLRQAATEFEEVGVGNPEKSSELENAEEMAPASKPDAEPAPGASAMHSEDEESEMAGEGEEGSTSEPEAHPVIEEENSEEPESKESSPAALHLVPESYPMSADLLEVAQTLDQHRLWAESGGKEGARGDFSGANLADADLTGANLQGAQMQKAKLRSADLSMANLRNANLVEADLRDANLLGTEFSGANLMGANLYGSQGLWAGRLGGANLFDATLPESVSALNGSRTIEQFTQAARWFYLMVMAVCVGTGVLIAMTRDVRLLLDQSVWRTPEIPNLLPLQGFYLGAPLLLTAMYLRLQFLLLRLWGSTGAHPAVFPDGQTPEKDGRWYLMGPIRPHLRWARDPRSPLGMVECYLAMLLAYWAVPAMLFFFWLRYLVLQDYRGTLLHVFLFTVASAAACGMPRIVRRVLRPGDWTEESTPHFMHDVLKALRLPLAAGMVLFVLSLGVIRGLPGDPRLRPEVGAGDVRRWAATAFQSVGYRPYAEITDETISSPREKAGNAETTSSEATGPRLNEINLRYARGYHAAFANARLWRANLEGTSLAEADFRGANLREANMKSARMDRVLMGKANLVSVDAQGAVFAAGDFQKADLSYANLDGATLATANLSKATLYSATLRHANLLRAELAHADFRDTKLEEAVLSLATLEQTDFSAAKMMGANLTGAQAKDTIFLEADLSRADLRGGIFAGAVLRQVKLDGANLLGADFRGALGLESWQICSAQGWRGAQFDPDVKAAVEQSCGSSTTTP